MARAFRFYRRDYSPALKRMGPSYRLTERLPIGLPRVRQLMALSPGFRAVHEDNGDVFSIPVIALAIVEDESESGMETVMEFVTFSSDGLLTTGSEGAIGYLSPDEAEIPEWMRAQARETHTTRQQKKETAKP